MTNIEKAIQYVRENKTWTDAEEKVVLDNIDKCRCPLSMAYPNIHYEISELMEEFWEDNELEGEWYEFVDDDTDSIFIEL